MKTQQKAGNGTHAVVIGSSMAGLLAARILTEHFDNITVVERDRLPSQPEFRQGVPQSHQLHVLLTQGYRILEELFPGFEADLTAAGAPKINWTDESYFLHSRGWAKRSYSNLVTRTSSRPFLEWIVRQHLYNYKNIKFLPVTQVTGLVTNADNSKVTGVKLHSLQNSQVTNLQSEQLIADFVIDTSGRNSQLPKWLEKIGYKAPKETIINSFLGYSTCWYELVENLQKNCKSVYIISKPPHDKRGGAFYPVENNLWGVGLVGIGKDYPPSDEAGFLEFARSLRSPEIYEFIKKAKPISPIYAYRRTDNCWHHYEQLSKMPDGVVVLGDAVCAFNPVYGQGMTTAALGALTLNRCLHEKYQGTQDSLAGLTKYFHSQLAKVLKNPWMMATSEDCRWETTEGSQTDQITRFMHLYMDVILSLSVNDSNIYRNFVEVSHMVKQPTSLFAPSILVKVLGHIIKSRLNISLSDVKSAISTL